MASNDKLIRIIIRANDQASSQMNKIASQTEAMGRKMRNVGASMTAGITAPLVGLGIAAAKAYSGYEDTLAEIEARTQASAAEMEKMSALALKMGADTKFSATDAAQALLELTSSGSSAAEAMEQLPSVLDLAAAGALELGAAADGVTDVLAAFQMEAGEAARVADALATAAGSSSATVSSLVDGFGNVGPVAKQFGLSVEETAAALAVFSENGVKGAEAGTQLRSMLLNMSRNTKATRNAWNALGTDMFDAAGNLRPLDAVMKDINAGLEGMTDQQRNKILKDLGGAYGIIGLNSLLAADGIESMQNAMSNAASANDVAMARMNTLSGSFTSLMGSLETLGITIMTLADGPLTSLIQWLTQVVNKITEWVNNNPKLAQIVMIFLAIAAAVGPVLLIVGQLVIAFTTIAGVLPAVIPAVMAFGAGLSTMLPIIIPLVAALWGLHQVWKRFGDQAVTTAKQLGTIVAMSFKAFFDLVKRGFDELWQIIKQVAQGPVEALREMGRNIMMAFMEGFKNKAWEFLKWLVEWSKKIQNQVKKVFKIQSPSKVMMDLGSQVGAGFQQGVAGMGGLTPTVPSLQTASAGTVGGGGGNVYIENLNVPPGTTREQVDAIMKEIGKRSMLRGARATR